MARKMFLEKKKLINSSGKLKELSDLNGYVNFTQDKTSLRTANNLK